MTIDLQSRVGTRQSGWGIVIFQSATIALLLIASAVVASSAHAATSTIGRVWPIAEPDALAEIEARTSQLPADMRGKYGPRSSWSAMKAANLAPATKSQTRGVVPFYTLDTEIRLPSGELLYPKGYSFNPLSYVTLPQRLVVVHPPPVQTPAIADPFHMAEARFDQSSGLAKQRIGRNAGGVHHLATICRI